MTWVQEGAVLRRKGVQFFFSPAAMGATTQDAATVGRRSRTDKRRES